jgi:hypothetical protein
VLHVHDLVDWAAEEARRTGRFAAAWLRGERPATQVRVKAGPNVRYANPGRVEVGRENKLYLRSLVVKNDAALELKLDGRTIRSVKKNHIQPSEMLTLSVGAKDLEGATSDSVLELSLV